MKKTRILKLAIFLLAIIFVLSGCSFPFINKPKPKPQENDKPGEVNIPVSPELKEEIEKQSKINKFDSIEDFEAFLEEAADGEPSYGVNFGGGRGMVKMEVGLDFATDSVGFSAPSAKMAFPTEAGDGSDDFSKTNVQVEGVDEADIIKTDGKYIYAVVKNSLYIINAYPAKNGEVLSKIEFKARPQNIYINDDKLVVFGQNSEIYKTEVYKGFRRRANYTFFKVFDISNPKTPKQVRDLDLEGNYSNSRMIGDFVYFVTNNYNYYYVPGEPIVPRLLEDGEVIPVKCGGEITRCIVPDIYYFDIPYDSYNLTVVSAINIKDKNKDVNQDIYTLSGNQNMYVSLNNIYITYTRQISEWQLGMEVTRELILPNLSSKNQERINEIDKAPKYILTENEKMQKISRIIERYTMSLSDEEQENLRNKTEEAMKQKYKDISKEMEKTIIHKIAVDNGELEYKTFGEVTGHVLNQFSMDENKGYFRIATTKGRTWSQYLEDEERESYNNMYVLDENMKVVGAVEDLARGERIYSVRFMQGRAYMVTFKQTDPLFVIDLEDPTNPKVLGELKIPGFSNYLHPYDENFLIGIGKDTKENEWGGVTTGGIKLSLFDVRDVTNPKEVDVYIMGDQGSNSIALNDHKAFLFSKEKNLMVMPVTIREKTGERSWGKLTFSGAAVFKVDESGFELKGKIDHSDGGKTADSDYFWGYRYYDNNVLRTLFIDDTLYTFSNKYLKANKLDNLELVKKIELKKEKKVEEDDFEVIN